VPNRGAAIRSRLRTVVISLLAEAFIPPAAATAIIVGMLAWLAYKTYKLVELK
jgi:hypothetical protein